MNLGKPKKNEWERICFITELFCGFYKLNSRIQKMNILILIKLFSGN